MLFPKLIISTHMPNFFLPGSSLDFLLFLNSNSECKFITYVQYKEHVGLHSTVVCIQIIRTIIINNILTAKQIHQGGRNSQYDQWPNSAWNIWKIIKTYMISDQEPNPANKIYFRFISSEQKRTHFDCGLKSFHLWQKRTRLRGLLQSYSPVQFCVSPKTSGERHNFELKTGNKRLAFNQKQNV